MTRKAVNRSEITQRLADHLHLDPLLAEEAIKLILSQMSTVLAKGERIEIRGFGSFEIRHRPPRIARNPKTGEKVHTQARQSIHFKPGKEIKNRINKK